MKEDVKMITAFLPVFQEKVDKMKKRLKNELEKAKSERQKETIQGLIKEIKRLQKTIKSASSEENRCPHCGETL